MNIRKCSDGIMGEFESDDLAWSDVSTMRLDVDKFKGQGHLILRVNVLWHPHRRQGPNSGRCALQTLDLVASARTRIIRHREEMCFYPRDHWRHSTMLADLQ